MTTLNKNANAIKIRNISPIKITNYTIHICKIPKWFQKKGQAVQYNILHIKNYEINKRKGYKNHFEIFHTKSQK